MNSAHHSTQFIAIIIRSIRYLWNFQLLHNCHDPIINFHQLQQEAIICKNHFHPTKFAKKNGINFHRNNKKCCKICLVTWRSMAHQCASILFTFFFLLITMRRSSSNSTKSGVIFVVDSSTTLLPSKLFDPLEISAFHLNAEWKVHNAAKFESAINKWWLVFSTIFRVPKPIVSTIAHFPVLKCRKANFMVTQNLGLAIQTEWNAFFQFNIRSFFRMAAGWVLEHV